MPPLLLIRAAIAAVWLYEGLWCKVMGRAAKQMDIVEAVPLLGAGASIWFLPALGVLECLLGFWVLSGWNAWGAAAFSTILLGGMNSVGITYARGQIHDPAGMVLKNFVLIVLTWVAAAPVQH